MNSSVFQQLAKENIETTYHSYCKHHDCSDTWLKKQREKALEQFLIKGIPIKRDEDYKYTSLEQHLAGKYRYMPYSTGEKLNLNEIFKCDVPSLDTHLIVLVNGWFYPTVSQERLVKTNDGVVFGSLNEAFVSYSELIKQHFNRTGIEGVEKLDLINLSLMQDGLFVHVPKGSSLSKPIQVINLVVAEEPVQVYPRHLVISESSKLTRILFCDHSLNASPFIMNGTIEIYLAKESRLEFYRMQNAHNHSIQLTNNYIFQEEESHFKSLYVTLHGGMVRNNMQVNLNGKQAKTQLYGLWLADKNQHIDYNTVVNHNAAECESNQFFKGILDDEAIGIFSGKIFVAKGSQKTNAYQSNKNLIISNGAKVRSKPHLEIYADDVKCSHGSATGKLNDDAMFYLRSRGISHKESCQLLMFAFASDITNQISIEPLKEEIETLVEKRLRGELSRCNRCSISCS